MPAQRNLFGGDAVLQGFLFLDNLVESVLGAPLEGGKAFGDEGGNADGDVDRLALFAGGQGVVHIDDPLAQSGNSGDILDGLGGEAQHKVKLYRSVAALKGDAAGLHDLFLADVFINDVPQSLGACFRGEGETAFADPAHLL